MSDDSALMPLRQNLLSCFEMSDADWDACRALVPQVRDVSRGSWLIREGEPIAHCSILLKGVTYRHKITCSGQRQIVALSMPGDIIDLHNLHLPCCDHNVQALTDCQIGSISASSLRDLSKRDGFREAFFTMLNRELAIAREWALSLGRHSALERVGHLLCEFYIRQRQVSANVNASMMLNMTQEQIADMVGLTTVHVNRVFRQLVERRLIVREGKGIFFPNWIELCKTCDFSELYLYSTDGEW